MPGELSTSGLAAGRGALIIRQAIGQPPALYPGQVLRERGRVRTWSFSGRLDQVREARAVTAGLVSGLPVADDAVLCVSELAANAVQHSHSREHDGRFVVRVEVHPPDYTWVEVEDDGGPWESQPDDSPAGHGLDIVGKLASEWGVDGGISGWIVWARLDWPRT